jgi:hypothetical protein
MWSGCMWSLKAQAWSIELCDVNVSHRLCACMHTYIHIHKYIHTYIHRFDASEQTWSASAKN